MAEMESTMKFTRGQANPETPEEVITVVYNAMQEKGYDPINQLVGYLISGDPTYITSHNNARYMIRRKERDELMEEFVKYYLEQHFPQGADR